MVEAKERELPEENPYKQHALRQRLIAEAIPSLDIPVRELPSDDLIEYYQFLQHLSKNIAEVIPPIHDLWSAELFLYGYSYAPQTDEGAKKHALLVPHAELVDPELEEMIAVGDIMGIMTTVEGVLSSQRRTRLPDESGTDIDPNRLLTTIGTCARDADFVKLVTPKIHDAWSNAQLSRGNSTMPGVGKLFSELGPEGQRKAIKNARVDILATGLALQNERK